MKLSDFNLSLSDLSCINYPGDNSYSLGYPNKLTIYLQVITEISNKFNKLPYNEGIVNQYSNFCSDYQPWSRTLSTFVNIHSNHLFQQTIPSIDHIKDYSMFIGDVYNKNILLFEKLLLRTMNSKQVFIQIKKQYNNLLVQNSKKGSQQIINLYNKESTVKSKKLNKKINQKINPLLIQSRKKRVNKRRATVKRSQRKTIVNRRKISNKRIR